MLNQISALEVALRLFTALLCGCLVGWDREAKDKPAGIRTHMMVALGACTAMIAAGEWYYDSVAAGREVVADPLRVMGSFLQGLGFVGAGSIMRARGSVQGVTTAAGLLVIGTIGLVCGIGQYVLAGIATVLAFLVLKLLRWTAT